MRVMILLMIVVMASGCASRYGVEDERGFWEMYIEGAKSDPLGPCGRAACAPTGYPSPQPVIVVEPN